MQPFQLRPNNIALLIIDIILINVSIYGSLLLRFEGQIPLGYHVAYTELMFLFTGLNLAFFMGMKLYNRIWQYASIGEMQAIIRATSAAMAAAILITYIFQLPTLPRSVYIISWVMINALIGASRIYWRIFKEHFMGKSNDKPRHALIFGAGDAGEMLIREIQNNPKTNTIVEGFIDDDKSKYQQLLHGIPVLGNRDHIPTLVSDLHIEEIIIAMPSVSGRVVRSIVEMCRPTGASIRILPSLFLLTKGSLLANLRAVQMEDLLHREPVQTDLGQIAHAIGDKTVLITGAGGSIGSELCRQVLSLDPARLIMVDNCENNLFDIEMELNAVPTTTTICPELCDVKQKDKLERVFNKYQPQVVFHAAAYKHVPMMERHPDEAIANNVIGTRNTAQLADSYEAETFILVSTDKAVNPTSVMGATKRLAELVVKDINRNSQTRFASVRFGNVLGSRGSVIPTFIKQIEKGGPVTVTDPEMRRYFMTIPEAVQLILQAGSMAQGGEIFVLDMGEMVRIDDLARDLISLSGREPDRDIQIVYSGIRPGEKLYEELFTDREGMMATQHERIFISRKEMDAHYTNIGMTIMNVYNKGFDTSTEVIDLISGLIPEYQGKETMVG